MEMTAKRVLQIVESSFSRMTAMQAASLKTDAPDNATKTFLAELLLESIRFLTKEQFMSPKKSSSGVVSAGDVESVLGDSMSRSFSVATETRGEVSSDNSENLNKLVSEEVASNFLPAFRNAETRPCFIPAGRLDAMVSQACAALKDFARFRDSEDRISSQDRAEPAKSPEKRTVMTRWLQNIVDKTATLQEPKTDQTPIEELVESVEQLFVQRGDYDGCQLKTITPDILLILAQELCDIIYIYITDGRVSISPGPVKRTTRRIVVVPRSHTDLYMSLKSDVWDFLTLMSWWLETQAESNTEQVASAPETTSVKEEAQEEEEEKKNACVRMVAKNLVSRLIRKTKGKMNPENEEDIINRLTETTWSKVKDVNIQLTNDELRCLDKWILKDLCKMWGKKKVILQAMRLEEKVVDEQIASTIKRFLLTPPKKHNAIFTFFSKLY